MFPDAVCCFCAFESVFLDTNRSKGKYCPFFEKLSLTGILNTKRVQLVKQSFSDLIYVPWMDILNPFSACY